MFDKELLHNTLSIQSQSKAFEAMHAYIRRFARRLGDVDMYESGGNIYLTRGKASIYPCIVAHTDTVHPIIDDFVVNVKNGIYVGKDRKTNQPHGVGGDDKVGIAIALHALRDHDAMKVVFFRDEEIGCVGSSRADMSFFDNCAFVVQCDRRGNRDVVNSIYGTTLYDQKFSDALQPYLRQYGFSETTGALTDVYTLRKRGLDVASFNMSAGYHDPHTARETVSYADVNNVYDFVTDVIHNLADRRWHSAPDVKSYFSLWEGEDEEEEEESAFDNDDIIFVGSRFSGQAYLDTCPTCGENDLEFDDTVGAWFCMVCFDYVFVEEEVEVS